MRDKRPVDELSIEELEQVLLVRKREARMQRFRGGDNRRVDVPPPLEQSHAVVPAPQAAPVPKSPPPAEMAVYEPPALDDGGVPQFEDDLMPAQYEQRVRARPTYDELEEGSRAWRRVTNFALFIVELAAIAGLLFILFLAYTGLTTVNENIEKTDKISETSEALLASQRIQPTATPVISISQVVLPGGHIWDASGRHRFNINEVPAPYRSEFQQQLDSPTASLAPIPEGGPIRLQIPALTVDASIRSGDDWISLQAGVGHHPISGNPGVEGNMVLTGHNDIFGEVFRRLDELQPGDEIRVQATSGQWYTYIVRDSQIVDPTEVWVLDQSLGVENPIVTLISCYPYRIDSQRIVVFGELADS